ncbi:MULTISPECIES: hypothetical protein [Methylobacteriaceae]|jgi:hypothetical protein|uniref:Uncharacterized protein n=3 Tax=Methylobacterium TaxID=407 RepID=A0A512J1G8_9HYPH|nr:MULTISPECIES: hypothetical protein [Methylobacterium]MBY0295112.1 hypothetical protein [Methylobacterium sp.]MDN3621783.1 hypothetical protein [Methylobacterium isbiliense]GEP03811.1 hypothetical protein MOX02_18490 [Methylobacterium oxalidis]GJD98971.1 hypothetical protein GMJLKIPL_0884 [Methylobacterium isbiliense]GJE33136.1 hypothetical protein LDDCCGHA_3335 [Methylobacterium oxalidis]
MRTFLALVLAVAPAAAEPRPAPGRYCAVGQDLPDISIGPGRGVGIDLMDCATATIADGRVRAPRCFGMGGAEVPYDTDLVVCPDGSLEHDGAVFRRCR